MQNGHEKFIKNKRMRMCQCRGSHLPDIPYLILYCMYILNIYIILNEPIKNLQFLIFINLFFLSKLLLA